MNSVQAIGFGAMNIDELYQVQSVLSDNETTIGKHQSLPGGSAANTIYGLGKLGIKTGFIGAVGSNKAGKSLLRDLKRVGVDTSQIKVKEQAETGTVLGLTDRSGNRALYVNPGANKLLQKDDIDLDYITQSEIIHLSSFVNDCQLELQEWVVNNLPSSTKISFTPGAIYTRKGRSFINPILEKTYILFTNESEIKELANTKYFEAGAEHFLRIGCQIVVITLGRGTIKKLNSSQLKFDFIANPEVLSVNNNINSMIKESDTELRFASYIVDANYNKYVVESRPGHREDTTGAGDAFATGFLYGLLRGKETKDCALLGDIVAQFSIIKMGARQGLPTITQLSRRYLELYNRQL